MTFRDATYDHHDVILTFLDVITTQHDVIVKMKFHGDVVLLTLKQCHRDVVMFNVNTMPNYW
jgi:hypothetical protein